jgi:four helix bundle protein
MLNLSHKKLDVYQIALGLLKKVYQLTKYLPREEQFLLISQLRRAAISVCSNIAEGAARRSSLRSSDFLKAQEVQLLKLTRNLKFR